MMKIRRISTSYVTINDTIFRWILGICFEGFAPKGWRQQSVTTFAELLITIHLPSKRFNHPILQAFPNEPDRNGVHVISKTETCVTVVEDDAFLEFTTGIGF